MKIRDFLPIQGALRAGKWRIFEWSLLDNDEDDEKELPGTASTIFGFAREPVDELSPRLEPFGDDGDPAEGRFRRSRTK